MRFETDIDIDAPPATVWAVLSEVERWPEWTASMREVAWIEGGSLSLGASARVRQPGMPPLVWTVCELTPGRSFTWRNASAGLTTSGGHLIEPLGDNGARLILRVSQTGPLASLAALLSGAQTRRYVRMEAEGLKRTAEARARADEERRRAGSAAT